MKQALNHFKNTFTVILMGSLLMYPVISHEASPTGEITNQIQALTPTTQTPTTQTFTEETTKQIQALTPTTQTPTTQTFTEGITKQIQALTPTTQTFTEGITEQIQALTPKTPKTGAGGTSGTTANESTLSGVGPFLTKAPTVRNQYLNLQSTTATYSVNNNNGSNVGKPGNLLCGNNQQAVGIWEQSQGNATTPVDPNMPRNFHQQTNYLMIPRCADIEVMTLECDNADWVSEYNALDVLNLQCANESYQWETKGQYTSPYKGTTKLN